MSGVRFRSLLAIAIAGLVVGCGDQGADGQRPLAKRASADDLLRREPYMGVSCRRGNSFACDRVGLAVWLREPAVSVEASIAGRHLRLDDPEWSGKRRMFAGFLQPAGLIDGALELTADASHNRWIGREPVSAPVRLTVVDLEGGTVTTRIRVGLSPGWG
jgi:hypothetical protein